MGGTTNGDQSLVKLDFSQEQTLLLDQGHLFSVSYHILTLFYLLKSSHAYI